MKRYIIFSILIVFILTSGFAAAEVAFMYGDVFGIIVGIVPLILSIMALRLISYEPSFRKYFRLDKNIELPTAVSTSIQDQLTQEQVNFINNWSLGGMLGWIYLWGSKMDKDALKVFIPIYGSISTSRLVDSGRRIVWDSHVWSDFDTYKRRQLLLDRLSVLAFIVAWVLTVIIIGVMIYYET